MVKKENVNDLYSQNLLFFFKIKATTTMAATTTAPIIAPTIKPMADSLEQSLHFPSKQMQS